MASAVDRTIGASMGDLSRRIKRIIRNVTLKLREEMQELEIQKRIAETGRDYHMKEKRKIQLENIQMKAKLDKCERMKRQLDKTKALARTILDENKKLTEGKRNLDSEIKSLEASLVQAENALEAALAQADDKIDVLEAQLAVATKALERVNTTKLRF